MPELFGYLTTREYDAENSYRKENILLQHPLVCIIALKEMEAKISKYISFPKLSLNNIWHKERPQVKYAQSLLNPGFNDFLLGWPY